MRLAVAVTLLIFAILATSAASSGAAWSEMLTPPDVSFASY
ncbi:hypothetical protein [Devosia sp.]|nr:hypothetical protein [Devosia sp.]